MVRHLWRLYLLPRVAAVTVDLSEVDVRRVGRTHLFPVAPTAPGTLLASVHLRFTSLCYRQLTPILRWSQLAALSLEGCVA